MSRQIAESSSTGEPAVALRLCLSEVPEHQHLGAYHPPLALGLGLAHGLAVYRMSWSCGAWMGIQRARALILGAEP